MHGQNIENSDNELSKEDYFNALKLNWDHARHQENQRLWLLNIYAVVAAAIIGVIHLQGLSWISVASLFFLFFFSLSVYFACLKWNAEFANHITAIQWISEKNRIDKEDDKRGKTELRAAIKKDWS